MRNQSPDRLEIFLILALDHAAKQRETAEIFLLPPSEPGNSASGLNIEATLIDENIRDEFPALTGYLSESEAEKFQSVRVNYQNKAVAEKINRRDQIRREIGTDEQLIDESVHHSHINEALQKEIPAVQKIIAAFLPHSYRKLADAFNGKKKTASGTGELKFTSNADDAALRKSNSSLGKTIRRAFAGQFVSLRHLEKPTAFDRLSGAQLARLIRLTGIREVATACVRIEAVEAVAAFLRIFPAEDAQAIVAQLNGLSKISEARAAFAEHLVQTTLETESQPSAMLDLLGIWLIGVLLCHDAESRIRYTNQKLPLEIAPKLPEVIEEQGFRTPEDLQREISREIEHFAEKLGRAGDDKKNIVTKNNSRNTSTIDL